MWRAIAGVHVETWRDAYARAVAAGGVGRALPAPSIAPLAPRDPEPGSGAGAGFRCRRSRHRRLRQREPRDRRNHNALCAAGRVSAGGVGRMLFCRMAKFLEGPVSLWVLDGNPAAGFYARLAWGVPASGRRSSAGASNSAGPNIAGRFLSERALKCASIRMQLRLSERGLPVSGRGGAAALDGPRKVSCCVMRCHDLHADRCISDGPFGHEAVVPGRECGYSPGFL